MARKISSGNEYENAQGDWASTEKEMIFCFQRESVALVI